MNWTNTYLNSALMMFSDLVFIWIYFDLTEIDLHKIINLI